MRFYRYLIYRLYKKCRGDKDDRILALITVSAIVTLLFEFQLFGIYMVLLKYIPLYNIFEHESRPVFAVCFFGSSILIYIFLSKNNRIEHYCKEFEDDFDKEKGTFITILFYFGSILGFYLIAFLLYADRFS